MSLYTDYWDDSIFESGVASVWRALGNFPPEHDWFSIYTVQFTLREPPSLLLPSFN